MALLEMTLCGTAFLYEGQELGMCHVEFRDSSEFRMWKRSTTIKSCCQRAKQSGRPFPLSPRAPGIRAEPPCSGLPERTQALPQERPGCA